MAAVYARRAPRPRVLLQTLDTGRPVPGLEGRWVVRWVAPRVPRPVLRLAVQLVSLLAVLWSVLLLVLYGRLVAAGAVTQ